MFKKIIAFVLAMAMMVGMGTTVFADDTSQNYLDNSAYTFPITPNSEEWKQFDSKQQMLDVCQIPIEKLYSMTTSALLDTVLAYPLLSSFNAFNSYEDAYNTMFCDFNGFSELFSRKDVVDILIERYGTASIIDYETYNSKDFKSFLYPSNLEYLLVCSQISGVALSDTQGELIGEKLSEKQIARSNSGLYSRSSEILNNFLINESGISLYAGENWADATGAVKTLKGTTVPDVYKRSPELTAYEKQAYDTNMANMFPNATKVASASIKYNCHSYAWYNQSTSNPYWFNSNDSVYAYIDDGSYEYYPDKGRVGFKAFYYNGNHSGVVQKVTWEYGSQVTYIQSKWGGYGLYLHAPTYCPYDGGVDYYMKSAA